MAVIKEQPFCDDDVLFRFAPTEEEKYEPDEMLREYGSQEYAVTRIDGGVIEIWARHGNEWELFSHYSWGFVISHLLKEWEPLIAAFTTACDVIQELGNELAISQAEDAMVATAVALCHRALAQMDGSLAGYREAFISACEVIQELGRDLGEYEHQQDVFSALAHRLTEKVQHCDVAHGQIEGKLHQQVKNLEAEMVCYRDMLAHVSEHSTDRNTRISASAALTRGKKIRGES